MPKLFIEDAETGQLFATVNEDWTLEPGSNGIVVGWFQNGMPSVEGEQEGDAITEVPTTVVLSDATLLQFNLALLDACEEMGLTVREEGFDEVVADAPPILEGTL